MLEETGFQAPPVDALLVGERLHHQLAWDVHQSGRGRLIRRDGCTAILLRPDTRPERVQWAAAHELGESLAERICLQIGISADEVFPQQRELLANAFAQRLLLPTPWWAISVKQARNDLHRLKREYPTASYELLAWRLLDLPEPRVITIWDQGVPTRRRGNQPSPPGPPTETERSVWQTTHESATTTTLETDCGRYLGWAIHEPTWRREITSWELTHLEE